MKRVCIERGCPNYTTRTRCLIHARQRDVARQAKRGDLYKGDHVKRARACIAAQPWCGECGKTTDLTADHVVAGDRTSPLRTLCRACNSARANRARARKPQGVWGGRVKS